MKKRKRIDDSSDECELDSPKKTPTFTDSEDEEEKKDQTYKLMDVVETNDPMLGRKSV